MYNKLSDSDKVKDEGLKALLLSDYDFQRELQTRRALHCHVRYCQRKYYWEALEKDIYAPVRALRFCTEMYEPRRVYPNHQLLPRELFTETQWDSLVTEYTPRGTRKYYKPETPPTPAFNALYLCKPLRFDPYGLLKICLLYTSDAADE